jgi:predicted secreted protein
LLFNVHRDLDDKRDVRTLQIKKQGKGDCSFNRQKDIDRMKVTLFFLCLALCIISRIPSGNGMSLKEEFIENMTVFLGEKDNNREITAAYGETIQIELSETGAAGYKWHINKLDPEYLKLTSEETIRTAPEEKVGAPMKAIWKIMTIKKGRTEILMHYYRPWEGQDKALHTYRIKINII